MDVCCGQCGVLLDLSPGALDGPLGRFFELKRGVRKRRAVLIAEDLATATLLYDGTKTEVIPFPELGPALPWDLPATPPEGRSTAWRLVHLARLIQHGTVRADWDPAILWSQALKAVGNDGTHLRLLALDAVDNDAPEVVEALGLPAAETNWLTACAAARGGDGSATISRVLELPPDGYPGKIDLLGRFAPLLLGDPALARAVTPHLTAFSDIVPLARCLRDALPGPPAAAPDLLEEVASVVDALPVSSSSRDTYLALSATIGERTATDRPRWTTGSMTSALIAHRRRDEPDTDQAPSDALSHLPLPIIDDLVDAGSIQEDSIQSASNRAVRLHLAARLRPAGLSESELEEIGHHRELGRRLYLAEDLDRMRQLSDRATADHFVALDALRRGKPVEDVERLDATARPTATALLELLSAEPGAMSVHPLLIEDRTVWPAIARHLGANREPAVGGDGGEAFAGWMSLWRARELLYVGRWREAQASAVECLRRLREEAHRDEALNLLAFAQYQQTNDDAAIRALEQALEGQYSEGLLANIGIVAAEQEPETAARHLGRLIEEAPTVPMKLSAARRAFGLWDASTHWISDDESADRTLPDVLRLPLRSVLLEPMPVQDFRLMLRILTAFDREWVATAELSRSPHGQSIEAVYFRGLARGLGGDEHMDALARGTRMDPMPEWIRDERDGFAEELVEAMIGSLDDEDLTNHPPVGLALAGWQLIDQHAVLEPWQHVAFAGLGSVLFCAMLADDAEPADVVIQRLQHATSLLVQVDEGRREQAGHMLAFGFERVAITTAIHRQAVLNQAADDYNALLRHLRGMPAYSVNWAQVRQNLQPHLRAAAASRERMNLLLPHVTDPDLRKALSSVVTQANDLEQVIRGLLS